MRFKIVQVIPCICKRDYSTGGNNGSLMIQKNIQLLGREGELKRYIHSDIHTDRPSDEAGPRGVFAPKKIKSILTCKQGGQDYFCLNPQQKDQLFFQKLTGPSKAGEWRGGECYRHTYIQTLRRSGFQRSFRASKSVIKNTIYLFHSTVQVAEGIVFRKHTVPGLDVFINPSLYLRC